MAMEMEMEKERRGLDRGDGLRREYAVTHRCCGEKQRDHYGRVRWEQTAALEQRYQTFAAEAWDDCKESKIARRRLKFHSNSRPEPGSSFRESWVSRFEGDSQFSKVDSSARVVMQVGHVETGLVNRSKAFASRNWHEQEAEASAASKDFRISAQPIAKPGWVRGSAPIREENCWWKERESTTERTPFNSKISSRQRVPRADDRCVCDDSKATQSLHTYLVDNRKEYAKPVAIRSWEKQCRSRANESGSKVFENDPPLNLISGPAEIKGQADADKFMRKPQKFHDELLHTSYNIERRYARSSQFSPQVPKTRYSNCTEKSSKLELERSIAKKASNYSERSFSTALQHVHGVSSVEHSKRKGHEDHLFRKDDLCSNSASMDKPACPVSAYFTNKKKCVEFPEELSPSDSDGSMIQRALNSSDTSISSHFENVDVVSPGDNKLLANKDGLLKREAASITASLKPVVKHSIFNKPVAIKSINCSEVVKRKRNFLDSLQKETAAYPKKKSNQKLSSTSAASMLHRAECHESVRECKGKERSMQHTADPVSQREAKVRMENKSRSLVLDTLRKFDLLRRKISRDESISCKRPDLGAGKIMRRGKLRINELKRIGCVPGVEVGDQFFFRIEMLIVGLHMQVQAGIDFIVAKESRYNEPVAVSIIASVGYDYDRNNGETLIYTGQGGNVHKDQKQQEDQQLVRGNLALRNSNKHNLPVRVIRCYDRKNDKSDKIYTYDGLYEVETIWHESGTSGYLVYKFCLQRFPEQPPLVNAFSVQQL